MPEYLKDFPELSSQFSLTLNELTPAEITVGRKNKVWWECQQGHQWEDRLSHRVRESRGCPYCSGRKVLPGETDLATLHPELVSQWHPTKNSDLSPIQFRPGSDRKVWWQCKKKHEWEATIGSRVRGAGCPYCSGRKAVPGVNDFASIAPNLLKLWHPIRNTLINPDQVSPQSSKKVWWLGECGHEWERTLASATHKENLCPYCTNVIPLPGFNDLETRNPEVSKLWHPIKNAPLLPSQVAPSTNRKVWWLGECGHEWEARVADVHNLHSCPICAGKKVHPGFNDLLSQNPEIASQYHPTLNTVPLDSLTKASSRRIWWVCEKGHEWEATVSGRNTGYGCPKCSNRISKAENIIAEHLKKKGHKVQQSNRTLLKGKELDLYLPEKKIAVEFNGLYWHTESAGKNRTYHYDKWLACREVGVQLIQIWEDDWKRNPAQILRSLTHKIGGSQTQKATPARKTKITQLTKKETETFLNSNHIQGYSSGTYYLGLQDVGKTTKAVLVLRKEANNTLNIVRYATSTQVQGGFTKLLKHAERTHQPTKFITFSDNCVSDGGLYEKNGFTATKQLPPDYMYVVQGERKHKFGYRLKKFKNNPSLLWEEGLSERELALLNNLPRIWDAGKTKWEKEVKSRP